MLNFSCNFWTKTTKLLIQFKVFFLLILNIKFLNRFRFLFHLNNLSCSLLLFFQPMTAITVLLNGFSVFRPVYGLWGKPRLPSSHNLDFSCAAFYFYDWTELTTCKFVIIADILTPLGLASIYGQLIRFACQSNSTSRQFQLAQPSGLSVSPTFAWFSKNFYFILKFNETAINLR